MYRYNLFSIECYRNGEISHHDMQERMQRMKQRMEASNMQRLEEVMWNLKKMKGHARLAD